MSDRVTLVGQSFFEPLPAGVDVYLLKKILCDWPDREAISILKRCAEAARRAGRVVVLGGVTPDESSTPDPELLMMVLVGGKGRSLAEFRDLARAAGLEVQAIGRQPSGALSLSAGRRRGHCLAESACVSALAQPRPAHIPDPHCGRPQPKDDESAVCLSMDVEPPFAVCAAAGTLSSFSTSTLLHSGQRGWSPELRIKVSKMRSQGAQRYS